MNNRIKDLRIDNDLLQKDLSHYLGLTQAQYSRIENNVHELSYDGLIKLSYLYETSIDYILGITDTKTPYIRSNSVKICDSIIPLKKSLK